VSPEGATPARALFDYSRPDVRRYLGEVVETIVSEHGADGISLDGLGDVEGQLIPLAERLSFLPQRWRLTPVMDVYRLLAESLWARKPDGFVESGWVSPATAHPYAHTFRYADDSAVYDFGYPHPGLVQHFDYAVVQRLLGQRGQIGAVTGGLGHPVADQLLGAALATGAHVSLGSDLTFVSPEGFAALRALLVHYRPFAGETRTGPECSGLCPSWAATSVGDLTFVGLMNREAAPRRLAVRLADLPDAASAPDAAYLAYDVAAERPFGVREALAADVPAQSFRLFVLRRAPGVFWTTSSYEATAHERGWRVAVRGPAEVAGQLQFYLPGGPPREVRLDGRLLAAPAPDGEGATYDPASQVLSIRYGHAGGSGAPSGPLPARTIEIDR
jgi:hypothetical protein